MGVKNTNMIELQYFEETDFGELLDWVNTPEFLQEWGGPAFHYPLNSEQLMSYIQNANHDKANKLIYKVVYEKTKKTVGHISLNNIDLYNKSAQIEKVLVGDEAMRGKGVGSLLMAAILRIAFKKLKLHRVSLRVFDCNIAAISCYQKAGFIKEGLLRDYRKKGNNYSDLWEMSILENEWNAHNVSLLNPSKV